MTQDYGEDIIFMLTKNDILACASALGISQDKITDDVIEMVKCRVNLELYRWQEMVKELLKEATKCPLGVICYPSCFWWRDGNCTLLEKKLRNRLAQGSPGSIPHWAAMYRNKKEE